MNQSEKYRMYSDCLVCGIDEVGRGSLAGPLLAVAALFKTKEVGVPGVDDSKKLSPGRRLKLFRLILWSPQLVDFGIGEVSSGEIEKVGINHANILAFQRAVEALPQRPNLLIVDGDVGVPGWGPDNQIVEPKADGNYPVVSAASILAKVIRDSYMEELDSLVPGYRWKKNKGYGTKDHVQALQSLGPSRFHRPQFIGKIVSPQTGWSL